MRFKYIWLKPDNMVPFLNVYMPHGCQIRQVAWIFLKSLTLSQRRQRESPSPLASVTQKEESREIQTVLTQCSWWGGLGCAEEYGEQHVVPAFASLEIQSFPQNCWVRILQLFSDALIQRSSDFSSVGTPQLCPCSTKAAEANMPMNGSSCVPINLYDKTGRGPTTGIGCVLVPPNSDDTLANCY